MNIIAVDDEKLALEVLEDSIKKEPCRMRRSMPSESRTRPSAMCVQTAVTLPFWTSKCGT